MRSIKEMIRQGRTVLGIELGSTRIKAVLVGEDHSPVASGDYVWENRLENGYWTYSLEDIWQGLRASYSALAKNVMEKYGEELHRAGAIGFSAMMHGYMAFDASGELLVPFRTWRNSTTGPAARSLTDLFEYNIPERWSIAHLYQAILNGEDHVKDIDYITTLAGYIHWKLTGEKVIGIGDAAGMFPINSEKKNYNGAMAEKFNALVADRHYPWKLEDILPRVLISGENAGYLSKEGAALLDESGKLEAGIPLCPPEGDAGTGMAATNSVAVRTGNVSAGTSVFAMVVLEKPLKKVHPEIDMVTTPDGSPVAMVHANNCTSDLNAWVGLFKEFAEGFGIDVDMNRLYGMLYNKAMEGDCDCGGLISYGYLSGENITGIENGRPMFMRSPKSLFSLSNFMRTHLYSALGALKIGMDILIKEEQVAIDSILGHGGLFKTKGVGQQILADAINTPVSVMETAGEGGPWGMALLASYMLYKEDGESLEHYLSEKVFGSDRGTSLAPDPEGVRGFETFIRHYKEGLGAEAAAAAALMDLED